MDHILPLTTIYRPCMDSKLSPPACQSHYLPLPHFSLTSSLFALNLSEIHSTFCKIFTFVRLVVKFQILAVKCGDFSLVHRLLQR